jgi:hypothetical protein
MRQIVAAILLLESFSARAQIQPQTPVEDPSSWSYQAKKVKDSEYEIVYKLNLKEGWHIWSLTPGGDGYEIVPSFNLDQSIIVKSPLTEKGHAMTVLMEGMENKVTYLSGEVEYKQTVAVKGDKIKGEHEYQVCNDSMCLPPTKKKFEINLAVGIDK